VQDTMKHPMAIPTPCIQNHYACVIPNHYAFVFFACKQSITDRKSEATKWLCGMHDNNVPRESHIPFGLPDSHTSANLDVKSDQ
jgi:hypothetical protein